MRFETKFLTNCWSLETLFFPGGKCALVLFFKFKCASFNIANIITLYSK